jgi:hypothetical protein
MTPRELHGEPRTFIELWDDDAEVLLVWFEDANGFGISLLRAGDQCSNHHQGHTRRHLPR